MSFHFQPTADSSDEETPVNLSAWTTAPSGVKRKAAPISPPLPPAPLFQAINRPAASTPEDSPAPGPSHSRPGFLPLAVEILSAEENAADEGDIAEIARSRRLPMLLDGAADEEDEYEERNVDADGAVLSAYLLQHVLVPHLDIVQDEVEDFTTGGDTVKRILRQAENDDGSMIYQVEFEDYLIRQIALNEVLGYANGQSALEAFEDQIATRFEQSQARGEARMSSTRPGARRRTDLADFVSTVDAISDDEHVSDDEAPGRRRGRQLRKQELTQYDGEDEDDSEGSAEDSIDTTPRRTTSSGRALRSANRPARLETSDDEVVAGNISGDDAYFLQSDLPGSKKRPRTLRLRGPRPPDFVEDDIGYERNKRQRTAMRHSERTTRHQGGMKEVDVDNIYRSDSDQGVRAPMKPKTVGTKEIFKPLPPNNEFRLRHTLGCETCGNGSNFAPLIHCQGCTLAYHKGCLGHRTGCEHLVTKVGEDDFVLQCRRCLAFSRKKDGTAPDQGKCQECHEHGVSCRPFRHRKTPLQEQREREENDGVDPITPVDPVRINVANNVMFRCVNCMRAWHFEHLPSRSDIMDLDTEVDVDQRFREYSRDWNCRECADMPAKVSALIAWKPIDEDSYDDAMAYELIDENEKAYLVKWADMSYFRACWMPGAWVWGVTNSSMRKAFAKREDAQHPKMRTKDAIPEDYFRADIVLHIKYTSIVDIRTQEIDKARILEVDKALIKYKGLSYEDAVWEKPPRREDGERWTDFVRAYNDWVFGRYVRPPKPSAIKSRLEKARVQSFEKFEKQAQPDVIEGGELMQYQIEGLNWLYYKWYTQKNAILADEMGLGKTIQMIGFLATLVQDWNCFPFLIVVPNSTCPNWRREVKRWAPSLRVVAFYGSKESRDLAYRYELFPEGSKELRCHIVIISYETAGDEHCRKFLRSVPWQGLILDEGQRLKSGKTQLYAALGALKAPFKILMTGTPLQNNQRELFNLLQFLDDGYDAEQLEQRFRDLDQSKINELHDMIRPFFLRRTKAQVLTFLPPMAQIILPVSMSVVQKKVYRTILAKNPDLMKAIFSPGVTLKGPEKASLSNILMQLRKCLCHPFVYNKGIEERSVSHTVSHRNLVDASSKLKLLELLLPKLQERGHRVLIFSQFLDMLDMVEDFLDGMGLLYQRLDGTVSSLQKQKRIDEFNAPGSAQFAFLLSTRAGGVGINLATADTVIILDPDFNPHQDIQALSRAHRIGQTKKVLCFQLVTRSSAEEKIMQIGRKKLALDHVLIQEMDAEDASQTDLVSVLRYGANELFNDDGEQDIVYDNLGVEKLLDRSQIEDTAAGRDQSAETQWSFARVWANNQATLQDAVVVAEEQAPDPGVWDNILKERERIAAEEAVQKAKALGRGRRARGHIDYAGDKVAEGVEGLELPPQAKRRKVNSGGESDTDFQDEGSGAESGDEQGEMAVADSLDLDDAKETKRDPGGKKTGKKPRTQQTALPTPITTPQGKLGAATAQAKAAATPIKSAKKPAKVKSQPRARGSAPTAKKPRGGATHTISFPGKGLLMAPKPRRPRSKITTKSAEAGAQPPKHVGKKQARAKASAGGGQTPAAPMKESASQPSHTASVLTDTNVNVNVSNPANAGNVAVAGEESDDKVSENNITFTEAYSRAERSTFHRAVMVPPGHGTKGGASAPQNANSHGSQFPPPKIPAPHDDFLNCVVCQSYHMVGFCPLKLAGVEHCNLCGIAHFGHSRICPHIQSETQVRAMLEALKQSNEAEHLVRDATKYLKGVKGNLVQMKRIKVQKEAAARQQEAAAALYRSVP